MKSEHAVVIGRLILENPTISQRQLSAKTELSLGLVNGVIKECIKTGLFIQGKDRKLLLTEKGQVFLDQYRVKNAVILAAGYGSRCIPLTYELPKGLLEVCGRPIIERHIEQLHEKGITDIIIVVGYKKEHFDYLVDKYNVRLVYNPEFAVKNTLSSVYHVLPYLDNTYIFHADNWMEENVFNTYEPRSWLVCYYMDGDADGQWCVKTTPSDRIKSYSLIGRDTYYISGEAYITRDMADKLKPLIKELYERPGTNDCYWQECFLDRLNDFPFYMNRQTGNMSDFDSLEDLRLFDSKYYINTNSEIIKHIAGVFDAAQDEITDINPVKLGMTNHSFLFSHKNKRYIMRIPGAGTEKLINRKREYEVYQTILPTGICDNLIYFNPDNGYKITEYWENARTCDPKNPADVKACMQRLRQFHEMRLSSSYSYDVFEDIDINENLRSGKSVFRDYNETKKHIMQLREFVKGIPKEFILCHVDANPDNFLFIQNDGDTQIRLIDWEYAAMSDPHLDIAYFAGYSSYDKDMFDTLIDYYFENKCDDITRKKIYAYIAALGLATSNWCEVKSASGEEYGEFMMRQYRCAKDYYRIVMNYK